MKKLLLLGVFLHLTAISPAQVYPSSDCINAIPVCNRFLTLPPHSGIGEIADIPSDGSACLGHGERNSIWLKVQITQPGLLGFNIIPMKNQQEMANDVDLDFAVYSSSCSSLSNENNVGCNYFSSTDPTPITGMNNGPNIQDEPMLPVAAGETYYIVITNFRGDPAHIDVDFSLSTCGFCGFEGRSSVSGYVYLDRNNNCIKDAEDWRAATCLVRLTPLTPNTPGLIGYAGLTDHNGHYMISLSDTGLFRLTIDANDMPFRQSCPQQEYELYFEGPSPPYTDYNLGYDAGMYNDSSLASPCARLRIEQNLPLLRRCFISDRRITVYNEGNIPQEPTLLTLRYDTLIAPISANVPLQNRGPDVWALNLPYLVPGALHTIRITEFVSCTAPLQASACVDAELNPDVSDCGPLPPENKISSCGMIIGSYDPNDKTGFPPGEGEEHTIARDQELRYRIRFQNTGNDTAFTVVIRDTLTNLLDAFSVQPGISSHSYIFHQKGNQLTFTFNSILLPDSTTNPQGSQGFVEFSVKQKASNPTVYQVVNTASIYFDFNEPIHTQPSIHSIDPTKLSLPDDYGKERRALLYPNPAKEGFAVRHSDMFISLRLTDLRGRLLLQQHKVQADQWIAMDGLESGLYLVQLIRKDGSFYTERLVVE